MTSVSERVAKTVAARAQLGAQLAEVVDLAVVDDLDRAVLVRDRLVTAREVDDARAGACRGRRAVQEYALVVGPAVRDAAHIERSVSSSTQRDCVRTTPQIPACSQYGDAFERATPYCRASRLRACSCSLVA